LPARKILKVSAEGTDKYLRQFHATEKANSTERGARKVSDLKPVGQGSGIAEVVKARWLNIAASEAETWTGGGVDSHQVQEVGIKGIDLRIGMGNGD
jgi:hypothetical protein